VDKGAAWGLLARIYLNAAVYTGTARWADAKSAAAQVIDSRQYELAEIYANLFKNDNGQTQAAGEMIFAVAYDNEHTQSWGGTTAIVNGSLTSGDEMVNGSKGWGGYHVDFSYVSKFGVTNANYDAGTYDSPDKRALFYNRDRTQDMDDPGQIKQGWACVKYSRISSTGVEAAGDFSSADFPMMRLAEMYLIYAEATLRAGGSSSTDATALGYLNELRARAGLAAISSFDLNYLIDELARELMWESHRRTDLIRYGLYTGDSYLWPWKGGARNGRSIDARYNLCPLLQEDVDMNDNLVQNPGYIE
jgi:hypothetical protein